MIDASLKISSSPSRKFNYFEDEILFEFEKQDSNIKRFQTLKNQILSKSKCTSKEQEEKSCDESSVIVCENNDCAVSVDAASIKEMSYTSKSKVKKGAAKIIHNLVADKL